MLLLTLLTDFYIKKGKGKKRETDHYCIGCPLSCVKKAVQSVINVSYASRLIFSMDFLSDSHVRNCQKPVSTVGQVNSKYYSERKKNMVQSFYGYMLQFLGEDTARGDLARDMQYEQERSPFKTCELDEIRTWTQMETHLSVHNACRDCYETAKACWRDYEKTRALPQSR